MEGREREKEGEGEGEERERRERGGRGGEGERGLTHGVCHSRGLIRLSLQLHCIPDKQSHSIVGEW